MRLTNKPTRSVAAAAALAAATAIVAPSAIAALSTGAPAPDFATDAALAGKPFRFSLAESLKKGPVVLYFYPKAFTSGCTVEAHLFAEATPKFNELGATVVGMSNDDIGTLQKFSTEACRDKFAVAADTGAKIAKQYDATLAMMPNMADRISYVISPQGKILYAYSSLSPDDHVANTMKALQDWRKANPR